MRIRNISTKLTAVLFALAAPIALGFFRSPSKTSSSADQVSANFAPLSAMEITRGSRHLRSQPSSRARTNPRCANCGSPGLAIRLAHPVFSKNGQRLRAAIIHFWCLL